MSEMIPSHSKIGEQPVIRVLVVDDQPIVIESIRSLIYLETDIELHACTDPTLALSIAAELKPSVIFQDLIMPDVDGLMLVKFFRAHPVTKDTPIIVLSSRDDARTKASAFSTGANDYLVKLPDPIELIARLRYHAAAYYNLRQRDAAERTLADNKLLEQRVAERTRELKTALDDLKKAQSKLIHSEKMSSMGQLVAGIAHEVNNPINFIYGNLNYVDGYVQDLLDLIRAYQTHCPTPPPDIHKKLNDLDLEFTSADLLKSFVSLRSGTQRIRNLVLSLRNFSRFDESATKTVNLHDGIDSALAMMGSELDNITLKKDYGDLPLVECYASQINQVFMHLIRNAVDALKGIGTSAEAAASASDSPLLQVSTTVVDQERVAIWIADNGAGISLEVQGRIFDPFFTTKEVGQGTGLGLAISYQIVSEQHGGQLKCYSVPGQGTKLLVELPVCLYNCQQVGKVKPSELADVIEGSEVHTEAVSL
ncbi:MAG: response regulator [Phormidesmis sp.]